MEYKTKIIAFNYKINLKMSSAKYWQFCIGPDVLNKYQGNEN